MNCPTFKRPSCALCSNIFNGLSSIAKLCCLGRVLFSSHLVQIAFDGLRETDEVFSLSMWGKNLFLKVSLSSQFRIPGEAFITTGGRIFVILLPYTMGFHASYSIEYVLLVFMLLLCS